MKFGCIPINIGLDPESMIRVAQHAEGVGLESLWTYEHVIVPLEYRSKYPYSPNGKMGAQPDTPFLDPLIALTTVANHTKTIRLGTGVNILPQVKPLLLAKQAASIDYISGGRLMLGLGIGWLEEEFAAMDAPFERRGARFDDYVAAMKKVWSGETVEHDGEFVQWHGFKSYPLPAQKPLPVHIGGAKGKIMQRIARFGAGWYAPEADAGRLGGMLDELRRVCDEHDRDFSEIEITCSGSMKMDHIRALAGVGVHRVTLPTFGLGGEQDVFAGLDKLGSFIVRCEEELS
jgi:probable F420-dependent oxidoreductase